jgi:hypothetical protein
MPRQPTNPTFIFFLHVDGGEKSTYSAFRPNWSDQNEPGMLAVFFAKWYSFSVFLSAKSLFFQEMSDD